MSDLEKCETEKSALIANARTLTIAVSMPERGPAIGVSPFFRNEDGSFYIYSSALGSHVKGLLAGHDASFQIIADESQSQNIWTRVRLKFDADIHMIPRNDARFGPVIDHLESHFGNIMSLIKQFSDFHLFHIIPTTGVIVTGFASAYQVQGPQFTITEQLTSS